MLRRLPSAIAVLPPLALQLDSSLPSEQQRAVCSVPEMREPHACCRCADASRWLPHNVLADICSRSPHLLILRMAL